MSTKKSLLGTLDEEASRSLGRASVTIVGAILLPCLALILIYLGFAYFGWDFWSLSAFTLLVLLAFLLVRSGRLALGFGILALAILAYLGLETAAVLGSPLDLSFYLITDYLGIAVLVIAAGLLAPPLAPYLVAGGGALVLSLIALAEGPEHAEATIYADLALLAVALQVSTARRLLVDFSLRTRAATRRAESEAERARANGEELAKALKKNEFLLAELNHRVKNNLQILSSLMALQSSADPGCGAYVEPARRRIEALALVHEMLRVNEGRDEVDFGAYAESLVKACVAESGRAEVLLECESEGFPVSLKAASPCGLILSELAWNALEHAQPAEPPLRLKLVAGEEGEERFSFSVEDNGQGLSPAEWPYPSAGLGLDLVEALLGQTGSTIRFLEGGRGLSVSAPR